MRLLISFYFILSFSILSGWSMPGRDILLSSVTDQTFASIDAAHKDLKKEIIKTTQLNAVVIQELNKLNFHYRPAPVINYQKVNKIKDEWIQKDLGNWLNDKKNITSDNESRIDSWVHKTGIFSLYHPNKWSEKGIFYPYSASDEIFDKRSQNSKTFKNADGSFSAFMLSDLHYKDNEGHWLDIDLALKYNTSGNFSGFSYCNTSNSFETYFGGNTQSGVIIKQGNYSINFSRNINLNLNNPDGSLFKKLQKNNIAPALDEERRLKFSGLYSGIDHELVMLKRGVESGMIINDASSFTGAESKLATFSQEVDLPEGWYIVSNGKRINENFSASSFTIMMPDGENGINFEKVITYDGTVDYDEIMKAAEIPAAISNDEKSEKGKPNLEDKDAGKKYYSDYYVSFENGKLVVSYSIPVDWLIDPIRTYPLYIDPTVTLFAGITLYVTNQAGAQYGVPYNTYYHDQRCDFLLLASDLTNAGIPSASTLTGMQLLCSETSGRAMPNFRIRTSPTTATTITAWRTTGWTVNYGPVAHVQAVVNTWYGMTFTTSYSFTTANNIEFNISRDDTGFTTNGGNYVMGTYTNRCGYGFSDSGFAWPYDTMGRTAFSYIPTIAITYTLPCSITSLATNTASSGTSICIGATTTLSNPVPTGGTETTVSGYKIHTFTSNGTLTVPAGFNANMEVLIVAGGGGGGANGGGGGGGGGVLYMPGYGVTANVTATVGGGGAASASNTVRGSNGGNSIFGITVPGGGGGGSRDGQQAGAAGGSGGGGGGGGGATAGARSWVHGSAGGGGYDNGCNSAGAGGGGATAGGTGGANLVGGNGGAGVSNSISGAAVTYAGGGGGGRTCTDATRGTGGAGGGGNGGGSVTVATVGTANTGGGGGGGGAGTNTGRAGGSGIVIAKYPVVTGGTWASSNGSIASVVAGTGVVTGVAAGTCTITYTAPAVSGCGTLTQATTITVNPFPQVSAFSGNGPFCTGGTGQLTITTSAGTGPFSVAYTGGSNAGVTSGAAFNASPNPTVTTNYTLTSVTDANGCVRTTGFTDNAATITINPLPQGSFTGNTICGDGSGTGQITWTASAGTGPYTVNWGTASTNYYNYVTSTAYSTSNASITSGTPFSANFTPTVTTTYPLTSVTDANGCTRSSGFTAGTATITVTDPFPSPALTNIAAVSIPGYSPPGPVGATWGNNGTTGATVAYAATTWPSCTNYGFTLPSINAAANAYTPLQLDLRDGTNTNLSIGLACFVGTSTFYYQTTGGAATNSVWPVRCRIIMVDAAPLQYIPSLNSIMRKATANFSVRIVMECYPPTGVFGVTGGVWQAAITAFDAMHAPPSGAGSVIYSNLYPALTTVGGAVSGTNTSFFNFNGPVITATANTPCIAYPSGGVPTGGALNLTGASGTLNTSPCSLTHLWTSSEPALTNTGSQSPTPGVANATSTSLTTYTYTVSSGSNRVCYGRGTSAIVAANITSPTTWNATPTDVTVTGTNTAGADNWYTHSNWSNCVPCNNTSPACSKQAVINTATNYPNINTGTAKAATVLHNATPNKITIAAPTAILKLINP